MTHLFNLRQISVVSILIIQVENQEINSFIKCIIRHCSFGVKIFHTCIFRVINYLNLNWNRICSLPMRNLTFLSSLKFFKAEYNNLTTIDSTCIFISFMQLLIVNYMNSSLNDHLGYRPLTLTTVTTTTNQLPFHHNYDC